jgi:hypothetical protein
MLTPTNIFLECLIAVMDVWERELNQYNPFIEKYQNWKPDFSDIKDRLLNAPISYQPTLRANLAFMTYSFTFVTSQNSIDESVSSFSLLWKKGLLSQISLPVRFTFEMWSAVHYALKIIIKVSEISEIVEFKKNEGLIKRLFWGTRYPIPDMIGRPINEKSLNVLTLIDKLNDDYPTVRDTYEYLCISCHPTNFPLFYWSMASPKTHNWDNKAFQKHGHEMIQKTINAMDIALIGLSEDIRKTVEICIDIAENEKGREITS